MDKIKKDIRKLSKGAGSKTNARREAEAWFEDSSKSIREGSVMNYGNRFRTGMIHIFRYDNPKYEEKLEWWDRNPVVLALDPVGDNDFGINLNLLPVTFKEDMLDFIYDRMEGQIKTNILSRGGKAITQGQLPLTYNGAKNFLNQFGLGFAIRQYIPTLKANQKIVNYENWARITLCDFIELNGTTIGKIKYQFRTQFKK